MSPVRAEIHDDEVTKVPIVRLAACETNGRGHSSAASLGELVESVRAQGIINPLIVRPIEYGDRFEIVCGHRRLEAARLAGMLDVPVIQRTLTDEQVAEMQLTENLQREDLSPLDEAQAIEALLKLVPLEDAAIRLGKSRSYLASRLVLTRLPQDARLALEAGTLGLSVAMMLARIHDADLRARVAKKVQEGRPVWSEGETHHIALSLEEAREYFRDTRLELSRATFDTDDAGLLPEAGSCAECPKRSGNALDLFGDLEDDVCTDPPCFQRKRDFGWARRADESGARGYMVLASKLAKKILGYGREVLTSTGYVAPTQAVGRDGDSRSWLKVAKSAKVKPQTYVIRHPETDKPVQLWRTEDLIELLPKSEKARLALPKTTENTPSPARPDKPSAPDKWEVRRHALPRLQQAVAAAAAKIAPLVFLRMYVSVLLSDSALREYVETLGVKGKKALRDLGAPTLQSIIAMEFMDSTGDDDFEKALEIDVKPILAAARKQLLEARVAKSTLKTDKTAGRKGNAKKTSEDAEFDEAMDDGGGEE